MEELKTMLQTLLQEEFAKFRKEMDQRFDGVDKRFDGVDQRFDGVDKRFDGVDQRLDGVDQRFNGMNQRFDRLEERIEKLEDGQKGMQADIKVLKAGQLGIRKEVSDRFREVNKSVNDLRKDVEFTYVQTSLNQLEINRMKSQ